MPTHQAQADDNLLVSLRDAILTLAAIQAMACDTFVGPPGNTNLYESIQTVVGAYRLVQESMVKP